MICQDDNLALLDMVLSDLYQLVLKTPEAKKVRHEQREWLREKRNKYCSTNTATLAQCYRERIAELYSITGDNEALISKYTKILNNMHTSKVIINDAADQFIYDYNLEQEVSNLFGNCEQTGMRKLFWDGKHLLVNIHSSAVECTGRSVHYSYKQSYCLSDGQVHQTSTFISCSPDYTDDEKIQIFNLYLTENLPTLIGQPADTHAMLSNLFNVVWLTKNPYLRDDFLYSPAAMHYVAKNTDEVIAFIGPYKKQVVRILQDLLLVYESIINTPEWQKKFDQYQPYESSRYGDTNYHFISAGFPVLKEVPDIQITNYIIYTYHEYYHRVWYRLYKNGAMEEAYRVITVILEKLRTQA